MMAVCAMCGKRVAVHWPEFYVYKRGERFFCGANCMEVYDVQRTRERIGWIDDWKKRNAEGKERRKRGRPRKDPEAANALPETKGQEDREDMKIFITPENRQKAVDIAIQGGNPLRYLEQCGAKNPSATWAYIKKLLRKSDQARYEKVPEKFGLVIDASGRAVSPEKAKKPEPGEVPVGARVVLDDAGTHLETVPAIGPTDPVLAREMVEKALEEQDGNPVITVRQEVPDKEKDQTVQAAPLTVFGMPCKVTGIEVDGIEYQATGDSIRVRWPAMANMAPVGVTLMRKADWQRFAETLLKVMKYLGND